MIADVDGRVLPVAPLVLDDAGSLEAMAGRRHAPSQYAANNRTLLYDRRYGRKGRARTSARRVRACGCVLHDIRPIASRSLHRHL